MASLVRKPFIRRVYKPEDLLKPELRVPNKPVNHFQKPPVESDIIHTSESPSETSSRQISHETAVREVTQISAVEIERAPVNTAVSSKARKARFKTYIKRKLHKKNPESIHSDAPNRTYSSQSAVEACNDSGSAVDAAQASTLPSSGPAEEPIQETEERTIRVSKSSPNIYLLARGTYVGKLKDIELPVMLEEEWQHDVRDRLIKDLRPVVENKFPDMRRRGAIIEPVLCMTGEPVANSTSVQLQPTIWIKCGSTKCKRAIRHKVQDLSYIQTFSAGRVQVHLGAPKYASRLHGGSEQGNPFMQLPEGFGRLIMYLPDYSNSYSACGIQLKHTPNFQGSGERVWVIGGAIAVDNIVYGLTTAHAFFNTTYEDSDNSDSDITGDDSEVETIATPDPIHTCGATPPVTPGCWRTAVLSNFSYGGETMRTSKDDSSNPSSGSDFALIRMDLNAYALQNMYHTTPSISGTDTMQTLDRYSSDLAPGKVFIVCSPSDVRPGYLLKAPAVFLDGKNCFHTRKIQTKTPLESGVSGSWVVRGSTLLGMIVAIYSREPYVHMLPIADVFSDIGALLTKNGRRPKVDLYNPTPKTQVSSRISTERGDEIRAAPSEMPTEDTTTREGHEEQEPNVPATLESSPLARSYSWYFRTGRYAGLCLATFALGLDTGAFSTIVPTIIDDFNSLSHIGWYGAAYAIAFCTFSSIMIAMSRVISAKFGYLVSTLVFEIGSILCTFAHSSDLVITSRTLSGMGAGGCAAMIVRLALSEIPQDLERRSMLPPLYTYSYAIGRFVGPIVGGVFIEKSIWQRSFYLSTSIGGCAFILGFICLPPTGSVPVRSRAQSNGILVKVHAFDYQIIFASGCLVWLALGLHFGSLGSWSSVSTISAFIALGSCILALLLSLGMIIGTSSGITSISIWIVAVFSFIWGASFGTWHLYFPFLLQSTVGENPIRSGLFYLPTTGGIFILPLFFRLLLIYKRKAFLLAQEQGRLKAVVQIVGGLAALLSLILMAIGSGLSTTIDSHTTLAKLMGFQTIFSLGAGIGVCASIISSYITADYDIQTRPPVRSTPNEILIFGACLVFLAEQFGVAVSIPVGQAVFMSLLKRYGLVKLVNGSGVSFKQKMEGELLAANFDGFNAALTRVFFICTGVTASFYVGVHLGLVGYRQLVLNRRRRRQEITP